MDGQLTLLFPQLLIFPKALVFSKVLVFVEPLVFAQPRPPAEEEAPKRWLLQAAGISQRHEATFVDALVRPNYFQPHFAA